MIAVDTSVLVAIVGNEPDAAELVAVLSCAEHVVLSTATAVEAFAVIGSRWKADGSVRLHQLIAAIEAEYRSVDERQMRLAIGAYATYGRGTKHRARLNYGDCFSYALAKALDVPLLFKGEDFVHTDIRPALETR